MASVAHWHAKTVPHVGRNGKEGIKMDSKANANRQWLASLQAQQAERRKELVNRLSSDNRAERTGKLQAALAALADGADHVQVVVITPK